MIPTKLKIASFTGIVLSLAGCNHSDPVSEPNAPSNHSASGNTSVSSNPASKPHAQFDTNSILTPKFKPLDLGTPQVLRKTSSATYYLYTIGSGISSADKNLARASSGYYGPEPVFNSTGNTFYEATYSSRLAADPENNLWVPDGTWLRSGSMTDNEQTEVHYYFDMSQGGSGFSSYHVEVQYDISTEANYDWVYINSTSPSNCNSPGMIRKQISGTQSGTVGFDIPRSCGMGWLGIYYIKDYSVSSNPDYVRIKNVRIYGLVPVGL
jgi:hypothetical protein